MLTHLEVLFYCVPLLLGIVILYLFRGIVADTLRDNKITPQEWVLLIVTFMMMTPVLLIMAVLTVRIIRDLPLLLN